MFGNPETTSGGNALKFYSSVRMDIRRIGAIKDKDQIVGAHFLSEEADELVNHFTTAIQFGIPPKQFKQVIFAYPTAASDIAHML